MTKTNFKNFFFMFRVLMIIPGILSLITLVVFISFSILNQNINTPNKITFFNFLLPELVTLFIMGVSIYFLIHRSSKKLGTFSFIIISIVELYGLIFQVKLIYFSYFISKNTELIGATTVMIILIVYFVYTMICFYKNRFNA